MTDICDQACKKHHLLSKEIIAAAQAMGETNKQICIFEFDYLQCLVWSSYKTDFQDLARCVCRSTYQHSIDSLHSHWHCCPAVCNQKGIFKDLQPCKGTQRQFAQLHEDWSSRQIFLCIFLSLQQIKARHWIGGMPCIVYEPMFSCYFFLWLTFCLWW